MSLQPLTIRLPKSEMNLLEAHCSRNGITKTEAVRSFIRSLEKEPVDWHQVCAANLDRYRLSSGITLREFNVAAQSERLYVPLGAAQRPLKFQFHPDFDAGLGSRVYRPEKVSESSVIFPRDFIEAIVKQQSTRSSGKRLAIIGESGCGKSTYLFKIGRWAIERFEQFQILPILISLHNLGSKSLLQYLTEDWLPQSLGLLTQVPSDLVLEFQHLLERGRVCLLLDDADLIESAAPLETLADSIEAPLLENVPIVLTCPLNLWDNIVNPLRDFDVYRMLDFSFGENRFFDHAKQFVDNWFLCLNSNSSPQFWNWLNQPSMLAIKDSARNPLRLTLLCLMWTAHESPLSLSRFQIYNFLSDAFYSLRSSKASITLHESVELNSAFGSLAIDAISNGYKFLLPSSLVRKWLAETGLYEKTLSLGWLNRVGVSSDLWIEPFYAFFHPAFLWFFAALSINDWQFFLSQFPASSLPDSEEIRIFRERWMDVICLWLERPDILLEDKTLLIDALSQFFDVTDLTGLT